MFSHFIENWSQGGENDLHDIILLVIAVVRSQTEAFGLQNAPSFLPVRSQYFDFILLQVHNSDLIMTTKYSQGLGE